MTAPPDSDSKRRKWIDLAAMQLSAIWIADWIPRTVPLLLMAIVGASAYLLWTLTLTQGTHARNARLLLASSVIAPLGLLLLFPAQRQGLKFLHVLLLIPAGWEASVAQALGERRRRRADRVLGSDESAEHTLGNVNAGGPG